MNKSTNGKGNNPSRDEWETPRELIELLHKQYDFNLDCCATSKTKKLLSYCSDFESFLGDGAIAWMNPPFSKAERMIEHFFKVIKNGVMIYRCDNMETAIWQRIILKNADWVFIPSYRICYEGMDGKGSRFPSALIGIGVKPPKNLKGIILEVKADGTTTDGIPSKTKVLGILGILPNEL
jgi:hypothetical protein